ncbi:MAG: hypothetical protein IJH39_12200, partial [Clostridia bacterium]|nr:hypothetical protein [Clostridia bacterium]
MRNITNYILEKLHLNNDINIMCFEKGDKVSCLSLYFNNNWDKEIALRIREPFVIKSIDDDNITYTTTDNRDITYKYYINSNGYYQKDENDVRYESYKSDKRNYDCTILLKPYEHKEILELLLKEKVFNPKYAKEAKEKIVNELLGKYFDIKEKTNLDELEAKPL